MFFFLQVNGHLGVFGQHVHNRVALEYEPDTEFAEEGIVLAVPERNKDAQLKHVQHRLKHVQVTVVFFFYTVIYLL